MSQYLIFLVCFFRMTALVVKVLSLIAERQIVASGVGGRRARVVPFKEIRRSVSYLLSAQHIDGSFGELNQVVHRGILVIVVARVLWHMQ